MVLEQRKAIVVNLLAGPGSGKSTAMAGIFSKLKLKEVVCEMAPEFAKDLVWDERFGEFDNQVYLLGNQIQRLRRLEKKVDVIITDAPLLLTLVYNKEDPALNQVALNEFLRYSNVNYFLVRQKKYSEIGRIHKEEEAHALDVAIENMLKDNNISFNKVPSTESSIGQIANDILSMLYAIRRTVT